MNSGIAQWMQTQGWGENRSNGGHEQTGLRFRGDLELSESKVAAYSCALLQARTRNVYSLSSCYPWQDKHDLLKGNFKIKQVLLNIREWVQGIE